MDDQKLSILVIGSGGREHALAAAIERDPRCKRLLVTPGNPGIAQLAECFSVKAGDVDGLLVIAGQQKVDLTVVGPEAPLAAGIADRFARAGLKIFGPTAKAARLETSKIFCKRFLDRHNIPTARFRVFQSAAAAKAYVRKHGAPVVIKCDGLAAGKGVVVAKTVEAAFAALEDFMVTRTHGDAGKQVIIEDCLSGIECSYKVLCDESGFVPLETAMDYKYALDENRGGMTGGVGCVSPHPALTGEEDERIRHNIVLPTAAGLEAEYINFRGMLYFGLMLTADGPMVLEINCRFGDPETEVILPRLKSGLVELLNATASGKLKEIPKPAFSDEVAVCVTLYADNYPGKSTPGFTIYGLTEASACEGVQIFHAGTAFGDPSGKDVVTAGDRVLHIVGLGPTQAEARKRAYATVAKIRFQGMRFRTDIGAEITAAV